MLVRKVEEYTITMDEKHNQERIQKLYPLTDNGMEEAAANLDAYLEIAWEIFEDLQGGLSGETPKGADQEKKLRRKPVDSIQGRFDSSQGGPDSPRARGEGT